MRQPGCWTHGHHRSNHLWEGSSVSKEVLLDVKHLTQQFHLTRKIKVKAVDDVSFQIHKGEIFGLFNFETEVTSKRVPQASYKASVTEGKFEGYNIERNRTFYTSGLFDYIL